jgi:hypothetical protein
MFDVRKVLSLPEKVTIRNKPIDFRMFRMVVTRIGRNGQGYVFWAD